MFSITYISVSLFITISVRKYKCLKRKYIFEAWKRKRNRIMSATYLDAVILMSNCYTYYFIKIFKWQKMKKDCKHFKGRSVIVLSVNMTLYFNEKMHFLNIVKNLLKTKFSKTFKNV